MLILILEKFKIPEKKKVDICNFITKTYTYTLTN